ncbi:MAG: hypothetical protein GYB68_08005 [Chloroflexi bacterium]|nr:hypothetical protein [Chloroflexota bacterium]
MALLALGFWIIATIGFVVAALNFMGLVLAPDAWRSIAVAAALISISGIVLFSGIWPGSNSTGHSLLNTTVAMVMNLVILVTQWVIQWP